MIKFLDLEKQYLGIKSEIDSAISSVIHDSAFIGGKYLQSFEENFAQYLGVKHCSGVANGTDAIEIALESLELPKGSEIIVPGNTFIASSEAVTRSGHRVVFCDSDPYTYTISLEDARKRVGTNTSAIIAVHLYGHPCDMSGVMSLAKEFNLRVIEDCAQAHGAEYRGRKVGGIGDIATFSFYPGKNLGAYGDGGAIVTNDDELYRKCRMIANHGRIDKYNHEFEGRNSRLDALQAAILDVKLKHLDAWLALRREAAEYYLGRLADIDGLVLPQQTSDVKHAWHLFVIRTELRDSLQKHLSGKDIQTGVHYPIALSKLKAYAYLGQDKEQMFANLTDDQLLSLPMGEHLSKDELYDVTQTIVEYFRYCRT